MRLHTYPDRDMLAIDLANRMAGELAAALMHQDRATLIVPGGSTPGPVFDALCAADIDWARVDVLLSDERWVPESDPASNAAMLRRRLLVNRAAEARFLPFYQADVAIDHAAAVLATQIAPLLPASVVLLGMGADMHVASLFPHGDKLRLGLDAQAPVVLEMRVPGAAQPRVTLSAPVLSGGIVVHLLITGAEKRAALERAQHLPPEEAPVAAILDGAVVHWAQ